MGDRETETGGSQECHRQGLSIWKVSYDWRHDCLGEIDDIQSAVAEDGMNVVVDCSAARAALSRLARSWAVMWWHNLRQSV